MVRITWTGIGVFTDHGRGFRAASGSTHDVDEEQAEAYLNHDLFGDGWELADGEESTESDESEDSDDTDESQNTAEDDEAAADAAEPDDFTQLTGIGPATAERLHESGYRTFDDLREASVDELAAVQNVSESNAEKIHEQLADGED